MAEAGCWKDPFKYHGGEMLSCRLQGEGVLGLPNSIAFALSNKSGIYDAAVLLKGIPKLSLQPLVSVGHVWDAFW